MDANDLTLASYERHLRIKRRSPRTIQGYREALGQLIAHHDGADLTEMTRAEVEALYLPKRSSGQVRRHVRIRGGCRRGGHVGGCSGGRDGPGR